MRFCGIIPFFPCMSRTTNMAEHNKWMCALVWGHYRRTELLDLFCSSFPLPDCDSGVLFQEG